MIHPFAFSSYQSVSSHVVREQLFGLNHIKTKYKLSRSPGYAIPFSHPLGAEGRGEKEGLRKWTWQVDTRLFRGV